MTYPNFDLIEYKFKDKVNKWLPNTKFSLISFRFDTFMQTWSSTATGFADGSCCSGQAFTDEYTTVCEMLSCERIKDENGWLTKDNKKIYGVFFGNDLGYMIIDPNEQFFNDLKNRNMKSLGASDMYVKKD